MIKKILLYIVGGLVFVVILAIMAGANDHTAAAGYGTGLGRLISDLGVAWHGLWAVVK